LNVKNKLDEYFYACGTNIIISNTREESQKIIFLKPDCSVTSLFFSISSTNERLIIVGEKTNSYDPISFNGEKHFPRVEIINLDNKIIKERRTLDHSFYTNNKNSFILDAIIPNNSDLCFSLVKSCDNKSLETKLFVWEYIPLSLKTIFTYESHIERIVSDPKNGSRLIFFNLFNVGLFQYQHSKKKIIIEKIIELDDEVADVTFLKSDYGNNNRILVAYKDVTIGFFDTNLNHLKKIELDVMYDEFFGIFSNNTSENENNDSDLDKNVKVERKSISSNLAVKRNSIRGCVTNHFNNQAHEMNLDSKITYIISRDNLLFVFLRRCKFFIIMNINRFEIFEIHSVEFFERDVGDRTSININPNASIIYLIIGESKIEKPKIKNLLKRKGFKKKETMDILEFDGSEKNDLPIFEKKTIVCSIYNIDINNNQKDDYDFALDFEKKGNFTPRGIYTRFDRFILKEASNEFDTRGFSLSNNPRFLVLNLKTNDLVIFKEEDPNQLENINFDQDDNTTNKGKSYEVASNLSMMGSENKSSTIKYKHLLTKRMEYEPLTISISPYGDYFFLADEDSAYIYGILGSEVKELYKLSSVCRCGTFSQTGRYFSFSVSEFAKDEYNIIVIDSRTFETEYVINDLPGHANSMKWMDSDRILVALVDEKDIYGWTLDENRVISIIDDKYKTDQNRMKNYKNDNISTFLRLVEYGEKIIDFCYDYYIDFLLIISEQKMIKLFSKNCEESWEFEIECKYTSIQLIRKLDICIFGTSEGSIRIYIWPIPNFTKKGQVDPPSYTEKFLHGGPVIQLSIDNDLKYLYSCSSNGSIFVSSLHSYCNDALIDLKSFIYFDPKYMLNRKVYSKYSDFLQFTDQIYKAKSNKISKYEGDINGINIEFSSEVDKLNGENSKSIEDKKLIINSIIEVERRKVKNLQEEKEICAKQLKEKRENQLRIFKEEIKRMKKVYKQEKETLQNTTKILSNQIKDVKSNYVNYLNIIGTKKSTNESKTTNILNNVLKNLNSRLISINKLINRNELEFKIKIFELEEDKESYLKDEENLRKYKKEKNNFKILELKSDIEKILKDNRNHVERISEWEKNLQELRENNTDLMESFLFNTLKLKQMNKTLIENEGKISNKELVVMGKRLSNERLEKLRYVLEYQIKNLTKERTPIEEQIKNFEELNDDFYQRFNLLYAEQIKIEEFINENLNLVDSYKEELYNKKRSLYILKNILKSTETEINSIVRTKVEDKNTILIKLNEIHKKYLLPYFDKNSYNLFAKETKLQSKLMVKEIKNQKNKVMKDLQKKTKDISTVRKEKDQLMFKIQHHNTILIDECSSIRLNLEDILKYINDIEKKFIELTNTNFYLMKNPAFKNIKKQIKNARDQINDADIDKAKVAKHGDNKDCKIFYFLISYF
jgi:hypothetical protein